MTHEPQAARAKIAGLLELPQLLAGASAGALTVVLAGLYKLRATKVEYGDLCDEANTTLETVRGALEALRERAIERQSIN
jgi:hypothetical protein